MLSTFAVRSGVFGASLLKGQTSRLVAVVPVVQSRNAASSQNTDKMAKTLQTWQEAHKIFYGPERDMKNFPHHAMPEKGGKVRMKFIPEAFFQFFYPKTGVTGPYMFGVGLLTTLLSKEIWVIDHSFSEVIGFYGGVAILAYFFGAKFTAWANRQIQQEFDESYTQPMMEAKSGIQKQIAELETAVSQEDGQKYLWEAKRENLALQLEANYRERLHEVYKQVKSRLDYQIDVQNAKRRFEQDHMVNWIVDNVRKSITPQQEKESIKMCIEQLKKMSVAPA